MPILRIQPDPDFDAWKKAFDSTSEAEGLLAAMRQVWSRSGHQVASDREARIVEAVETKEY